MISEYGAWLRTQTNRHGCPFQPETISAYRDAAVAQFAPFREGQVLAVERRSSSSRSLRRYYWLGFSSAVIGVAAIVFTVLVGGWVGYLSGGGLLMSSAGAFISVRDLRRRQRRYGDALSEAGDDVLALVRQGRKIEAIKRYRESHPGIGLREAKGVVDGSARESAG